MTEHITPEIKKAIDDAVDVVVGDTGATRRMAKAYLEERAREDPRIEERFLDKDNNPGAWNQVLNAVAKEFPKELNKRTPKTNEWASKSGPEGRKEIMEKWGYDPGWR